MFLLFAWLSLKYLKLLAYSLTFNIDKKSDVKKTILYYLYMFNIFLKFYTDNLLLDYILFNFYIRMDKHAEWS